MAFQPIGADDDGNLPPQVEAKLATTYVRSVNGQTVDEDGNVVVTDTTTLATATAHADAGDVNTFGKSVALIIAGIGN